jgi:hypothetical protein
MSNQELIAQLSVIESSLNEQGAKMMSAIIAIAAKRIRNLAITLEQYKERYDDPNEPEDEE